jgi:outer membrane protein OmpA-like peptidoglycan-associated protein
VPKRPSRRALIWIAGSWQNPHLGTGKVNVTMLPVAAGDEHRYSPHRTGPMTSTREVGSYIWSSQMSKQKREMESATQGTGVQVTQTADNQLKLQVPSDVSFDVGSAQIEPDFVPILDRFARTLVENPMSSVRIVGHADSSGSDAINDPLSVNGATSVRNHLGAHGVASHHVTVDTAGRMPAHRLRHHGADPMPPVYRTTFTA